MHEPPNETSKLSATAAAKLRQAPDGIARVSLLVYHRDGGQLVPLTAGAAVIVGRAAPSDVVVPDVSLSRQHARFSLCDEGVVVEDLGSTNGTLVRGSAIERAVLGPGDEVTLGAITISLHELAPHAAASKGAMGHDRFLAALEDELARARFFVRSVALVMVRAKGDGSHVRFWMSEVQAKLRPVDRVGLYGEDVAEILLPEVTPAEAEALARALRAAVPGATLTCSVASYPDAASNADELLGKACGALQEATPEEPVRVVASEGIRTWTPAVAADSTASRPVCVSRSMQELLETAGRVARGVIPVLLEGETGTGKEVLARFVHESSPRHAKPMVCVNCAAIPAQLVESTLFGHEKGAFTGAAQQQRGVFETADGGTVFLDEVGELPASAQAALLRVLETKRFARVGSPREINVDVRIVAATHRDLELMTLDGRFRQDLLYRMNTVTLRVPPLRERREDIAPLVERLLQNANAANGRSVRLLDADAMEMLSSYAWPGNVRELKNAIERAVVIARGDTLGADDLPERIRAACAGPTAHKLEQDSGKPLVDLSTLHGDYRARVERLEAELLAFALREAGWNQAETARRLSMPIRTLTHKIKVLGLKRPVPGAPT